MARGIKCAQERELLTSFSGHLTTLATFIIPGIIIRVNTEAVRLEKKQKELRHDSVEKHLITKIPIIRENATVKDALLMLEKTSHQYDSVDYIYTIDEKGNLTGMFGIQELFNNPKNTPIKKFRKEDIPNISLGMEIEKIVHLALTHNLKQVPVTRAKKLIGAVPTKEILSTINKSLKTDIFHFAGIHHSHLDFKNSMDIPLFKALKDRLPWLIIGFIGTILIALYIELFEETLAKYLIITSFVPATVYISDALGTQFQTVLVRDLAVLGKELNLKKYFLKQMTIGVLIAFITSLFMFSFIFVIWHAPHLALIISLASFTTLVITSFSALSITFLIKRFKFDPALGSGPIATMVSDITSVIIYFVMVVLLI